MMCSYLKYNIWAGGLDIPSVILFGQWRGCYETHNKPAEIRQVCSIGRLVIDFDFNATIFGAAFSRII